MTDEPLRATVTQRGVLFAPDERVLVVRRRSDGGWELPGGRVDRDEDALAGLRREIREETALSPEIVRPVHAITWRNEADEGRFGVYYYCRASERSVSLSEEHDDYEWEPPGAVRARLSDPQGTAVEIATELHRDE